MNENGGKLKYLYMEKKICVENMLFKKKGIFRFTWVSVADCSEGMVDFVVVAKTRYLENGLEVLIE